MMMMRMRMMMMMMMRIGVCDRASSSAGERPLGGSFSVYGGN
jgi:hypothetical protein